MCVIDIYNKLQECYTSSESTYTDKAARFRTIFEKFVNEQMEGFANSKLTLGKKLKKMFRNCDIEGVDKIEDASRVLLDRLNNFHHEEDITATSQQLNTYYLLLLQIIKMLTGVEPDAKQLLIAGLSKNSITTGLNDEQRIAVLDESQFINVNAGPGTGKTHLLVRKLLYTLYLHPDWNIVALSFTNSAATQLKDRVLMMLSDCCSIEISPKNCVASTIHSYCYNQLSAYAKSKDEVFDYEILDDSVIDEIVSDIAEKYNLYGMNQKIKDALEGKGFTGVSAMVQEYKQQHHFIRVEEILDLFIKNIESDNSFKDWMTGKVNSLLIDESQDLSKKVYSIINILYTINPSMQMFFVGDPRQNIFSFNGGKYQNFKEFVAKIGLKLSGHELKTTYRCPRVVTNLVNGLAFTDCSNPSLIPQNDINGECKIIKANFDTDEAMHIVNLIQQIDNHSETCVIATVLRALENVARNLNDAGIPFLVKGGQMTMQTPVKLMNHCLRDIEKKNSNSENFLVRRYPSLNALEKLKDMRESQKTNPVCPSLLISELVRWFKEHTTMDAGFVSLLDKYSEAASKYNTISDLLFACSSRRNDDFAPFYARNFTVNCETEITDDNQPVTLSTIHSAKGLEWENVILARMNDDVLPRYSCIKDGSVDQMMEALNDEKKKYYVAVTRSKKNIYITYTSMAISKKNKKVYSTTLSRFVSQSC